ncbi:unnamed protein product [Trichobilharzia szidati]|nr:unnamed protein product [Trichobilharzia szidati]
MLLHLNVDNNLRLLYFYVFIALLITETEEKYIVQRKMTLYNSLEIVSFWIMNIPILYGNDGQQASHQTTKQTFGKVKEYNESMYLNQQNLFTAKEKKSGFSYTQSNNESKLILSKDIHRHQSDINLSQSSYPHIKQNHDISKINYYQNNSSYYYYPVNDTSQISKPINGHEIHNNCYVNTDGRQEIPCILNPYPLYELLKKFPHIHVHKFYQNPQTYLFQSFSDKQKTVKMILNYETGQYAYLPCHTLGAEESETTIWEKGQNPLFVSTVSFTQDSRFRLNISEEQKPVNQAYFYYTKNKSSKSAITNFKQMEKSPFEKHNFESYRLRSNWRHRQWDLIIDFLRPTDSDTYTCMLMGRTSQMIRYHVIVNDSAPRINYSRKKLINISSPSSIEIGSSFNLTCSVRVTKEQSVSIAVDWFRPTYTFETPSNPPMNYKLNNILTGKFDIHSDGTVDRNVTKRIGELAHSFQQVTSRSSMGITIYKQVTGELNNYYRTEVLLTVQSARETDGGLYECRVYEAANYGQENIVDRAFLDIIVRKRFPYNSFEQSELNAKVRNLLSIFWNLNPSVQNDRRHDQHAQNDVAARVKARYTKQDINQITDDVFHSLNINNQYFSNVKEIRPNIQELQNPRMRVRTIKNCISHLFVQRTLLCFSIILNKLLAAKLNI